MYFSVLSQHQTFISANLRCLFSWQGNTLLHLTHADKMYYKNLAKCRRKEVSKSLLKPKPVPPKPGE